MDRITAIAAENDSDFKTEKDESLIYGVHFKRLARANKRKAHIQLTNELPLKVMMCTLSDFPKNNIDPRVETELSRLSSCKM